MAVQMQKMYTDYNAFSFLCLNSSGQFLNIPKEATDLSDANPVNPEALPSFFAQSIVLPKNVTDVFVWVHGWQNSLGEAIKTARRFFGNLDAAIKQSAGTNNEETNIVPAFIAVHWPSTSLPTLAGYEKIRNRAAAMTNKGDAEFFLASLLGYLDAKNQRSETRDVLRAKAGYYIHCIGHSFGCRFLTAAIRAAGRPQHRTLSLLGGLAPANQKTLSVRSEKLFQFTIDSICFLQMAAPNTSFSDELTLLVDESPVRGTVALTFSKFDRANCLWHSLAENGEAGIGCTGAKEPARWIKCAPLRRPHSPYTKKDFSSLIVNINASSVYKSNRLKPEGAHSDFWHSETMHLIMALVEHSHRR